MNWPALTPECSQAIAEVLRDAVKTRPKNLFEHVAQQLQDRSGLDPAEFESHFEACKRKPRTYVLEERCPQDKDPFAWVPMRYNDDTILLSLRQRAGELVQSILHREPMEDTTKVFLDRACVAFPELMYMRQSPQELIAQQSLRAIYLGCSGCPTVLEAGLDDADPTMSFLNQLFFECARGHLFETASQSEAVLEALVVCCLLRVLGLHPGFQRRYGGGSKIAEVAVLHAIEHDAESLPSFQRLSEPCKELILAVLKAYMPLELLTTAEAVPAQFALVKELLVPIEGGIAFLVSAAAVEHLVKLRGTLPMNDDIDNIRLGTQSLVGVEKYSAERAYELLLKKRAERHSWRLMKDDFAHRATVRLCCFPGREDNDFWAEMLSAVESLPDDDKEVLKTELGRKDGLAESPVFVPMGAGAFMLAAIDNSGVSTQAMLRLFAQVLVVAARTFDGMLKHRTVVLHFEDLVPLARDYRPGGGVPFEGTPFLLEEMEPGEVAVRPAGHSRK